MCALPLRVLLLEDDIDLGQAVADHLEAQGHTVHWMKLCAQARRALESADGATMQLALLDLRLPDGDGIDLIRQMRQACDLRPVIVLTARDQVSDRVRGLQAGADDYLVKPFGSGELNARVRAQLRRHQQQTPGGAPQIAFGDVIIDLVQRKVERAGEVLHLTPIEYKLLTHLATQPDRVITHAQLLKAVWGPGHQDDMHYVRVHMANLRKKIEAQPSMPKHLVTETGVGYKFRA